MSNPTQHTERYQTDMSSVKGGNTKETEQTVTPSTLNESTTTEIPRPTEHSRIDMPRTKSSLPEESTMETTEHLEEIQLLEKTQNVTFKNASSNDEKNLCCDNCTTKNCLSYGSHFLQWVWKGVQSYFDALAINGEERVEHNPLEEEDFRLKEDVKIATYSEMDLKNHWNLNMMHQPLRMRLWSGFKNGILKRTFPILSVFLILYYSITIFVLTEICVQTDNTFLNNSAQEWITRRFAAASLSNDSVISPTYFCNNYEEISKPWKEYEHRLTRVLTFLIGFYVSFVIRNWWQNVRSFPTLDKVNLSMGSFIWVDSGIDENDITVKVGRKTVTLMQFKKDIIRFFLLSWAMCFCRISILLKQTLPEAKDFVEKGLLTESE